MTDKIVLRPESKPPASTKHFEDVWEDAEKLFDANKLNVDSILNELQAKISLYRLLGAGSFDPADLASAQASMNGKMLMTLASLSLKENVNVFTSLQMAINERRLLQMELTAKPNGNSPIDAFIGDFTAKARENGASAIGEDLLKVIRGVSDKHP